MSAGDGGAPVGKRNGDKEGERRRDGREDMRKRRGKINKMKNRMEKERKGRAGTGRILRFSQFLIV